MGKGGGGGCGDLAGLLLTTAGRGLASSIVDMQTRFRVRRLAEGEAGREPALPA